METRQGSGNLDEQSMIKWLLSTASQAIYSHFLNPFISICWATCPCPAKYDALVVVPFVFKYGSHTILLKVSIRNMLYC